MKTYDMVEQAYRNGYDAGIKAALCMVRCKDCKNLYFKDFAGYCPYRVGPCNPDGFCEYGERRETT